MPRLFLSQKKYGTIGAEQKKITMTAPNIVDNPLFTIEKLDESKFQKKFQVTIQGKQLSARVDADIAEIAKTYKLAGFSKKGAPVSLVKRQIGRQVMTETLDKVIQEATMQIVKDNDLKVGSMPSIEVKEFNPEASIIIEITFMIIADLPEADFTSNNFEIELLELKVEQSDLDQAKEALLKMVRSYKEAPAGHKAAKGDALIINFHGKLKGEEFEGNKANSIRIELGEGQFIKDFEDKLVGFIKGEERTITVLFPTDYQETTLAGQEVTFDIKVHDILVKDDSKSGEEELQARFNLSSFSDLDQMIREKLINDFNSIIRLRTKKLLFDKLDNQLDFELPDVMVEADFNNLWKETLPKIQSGEIKKSEEEAKKEMELIAKRRVKLGLVLADLSKKHSIIVTDQDIQTTKEQEKIKRPDNSAMIEEFFSKKENRDLLQGAILEEKVVDYILTIIPKKVTLVTTKEFNDNYSKEIQELMQ